MLDALWNSAHALTSAQLHDLLTQDPKPALTTIFTVLSRLEEKNLVSRSVGQSRGILFSATVSREQHQANTLLKVLGNIQNPRVALSFFADGLSPELAQELKNSLDLKN